jgi:hypothetical protein
VLRGSGALIGSARQQRSREALAIAEAGLESTLAALNTTHPYLLTNNHNPAAGSCWDAADGCPTSTARFPKSICRNMTEDSQRAIPLSGSISNASGVIGEWRVRRYVYAGNQFYGGSGTLSIEGTRLGSNNAVLATSRVEQTVSIKIKDCTPSGQNTIALLALDAPMNINKTDVLALPAGGFANYPDLAPDQLSDATAHCVGCDSFSEMNTDLSQARVIRSFGPTSIPPVPEPPSDLGLQGFSIPTNQGGQTQEFILYVAQENQDYGTCVVKPFVGAPSTITHCRISSITLNGGKQLKIVYPSINPGEHQMRLYVSGDISLVGGAGNTTDPDGKICQALYNESESTFDCIDGERGIDNGLESQNLLILGPSVCPQSGQDVDIIGGAQALFMFMYMPCAKLVIKGGSSTPDLFGAVWVREYADTSNNSQNLDIWVPFDLAGKLQSIYGQEFSISIRRPVALGINRWTSYESTQP